MRWLASLFDFQVLFDFYLINNVLPSFAPFNWLEYPDMAYIPNNQAIQGLKDLLFFGFFKEHLHSLTIACPLVSLPTVEN